MTKLLVCEDEDSIRSFVVVNLLRAGYEVIEAGSGEEALEQYDRHPDVAVALLDVMMPGIDGFETCRRLREKNQRMGIMMLTARSADEDKVGGLQSGADDYVTKPFSTAELVARVNALCRRMAVHTDAAEPTGCLQSGDFLLDLQQNRLTCRGKPVELTQVECQIMALFFRNPEKLLTRAEILKEVWHQDYADDKIVDVNIRRLRMKVEADPSSPRHLCTVWGRGYQWHG
ncbi:MAG: response regulator transcription factor [Ruminococcaceae bacterium]|nr:response regulator transcription factor [Oscillospiraceae bacterium]